jgi:hypothetical protein
MGSLFKGKEIWKEIDVVIINILNKIDEKEIKSKSDDEISDKLYEMLYDEIYPRIEEDEIEFRFAEAVHDEEYDDVPEDSAIDDLIMTRFIHLFNKKFKRNITE